MAGRSRSLVRQGVAKDQNGGFNLGIPELKRLGHAGHSQPFRSVGQGGLCHVNSPMPIGIGFDHRHHRCLGAAGLFQHLNVFCY